MVNKPLVWMPIALALSILSPGSVQADPFIDSVHRGFDRVPDDRRSDLVLLPLLAAMDPLPLGVSTPRDAAFLLPSDPAWNRAETWATGPAQVALIDAIDRVTLEEDPRQSFVYAQRYGDTGVPEGLEIGLAGGELLAGAVLGYLRGLDRASALVNIEATRRMSGGDARAAIDLLTDWLMFSRQICDRPLFAEAAWGYKSAASAMERMRDIAYLDYASDSRSLTTTDAAEIIDRLAPDGYIDPWRLQIPQGDRVAVEQIVDRVLGVDSGNEAFGATMALTTAGDRPLRLFGEASRWLGLGEAHNGRADTLAALERVYGDLEARFEAPEHSPLLDPPTTLSRTSQTQFPVLTATLEGADSILALRDVLRTELVGTRQAIALVGYALRFGSFPRDLSSTRPVWIPAVEADPFNPERANGSIPPLEYFVPIRDNRRGREPHSATFQSPSLPEPVEVTFDDSVFVLYSWGPDKSRGLGRKLAHTVDEGARDTDYLIWPPAISVLRTLPAPAPGATSE
ncbi:MAG: hypothetical protein AAGB51_14485 [Planctomycetota bacterium]